MLSGKAVSGEGEEGHKDECLCSQAGGRYFTWTLNARGDSWLVKDRRVDWIRLVSTLSLRCQQVNKIWKEKKVI